uniref:Bm1412 n=1 Tax=Brugia malayi TaxID=6279 RepID=A0A0J9XXN7_BRUMA|nr:Bm1412 [Brugia malayi]
MQNAYNTFKGGIKFLHLSRSFIPFSNLLLFINCLNRSLFMLKNMRSSLIRILRLSFLNNTMSLKMAINTKRNLAPERQRWNKDQCHLKKPYFINAILIYKYIVIT